MIIVTIVNGISQTVLSIAKFSSLLYKTL